MILNELALTNFGIYKGEHKVHLTPEHKKPIILFGALNGSGKTTFLDALQIVLYGKLAKTSGRAKIPYDDYLRLLINRDVSHKIGAGLSLTFTTLQNGRKDKIEVTRTWSEYGNTIKEHCEVRRNDIYDRDTSDRWAEFVEEYMPSAVSELFFFDGEKIEGLAEPSTSSKFIKSGIYSLLGINSIENLIKSLTQIEKRKALEISEKSGTVSLEVEEKIAKELSYKWDKKSIERAGIKIDLDNAIQRAKESEEIMRGTGANLLENRYKLQQRLSVLDEQKKNINSELIELSGSKAPLILLNVLLSQIVQDLKISSGHNAKSIELFKFEIELLKQNYSNELQIKVIKALEERVNILAEEVSKTTLDLELSAIPTDNELAELKENIFNKIRSSESIEEEIDSVNKSLLAVPSEEKVKDIVLELNKNQINKSKLEVRLELIDEELAEISREKDKVAKEISSKLSAIANQETDLIHTQRIMRHTQKSKDTLTKFKTQLINKNLASLGNEITNCFKTLQRKSYFNLNFEINAVDFALVIKKNNGEEISAKTLSAGERQLLAVAILWALAKSSGKVLPTVIDTPLGRLDIPHREKLITNYFPKAGNQVLIFATDAEISKANYLSLQPYISREFTINYDESTESSTFIDNYFGLETV